MLCLAITQRTPEVFLSLLFQSKESMAVLSVGGKKRVQAIWLEQANLQKMWQKRSSKSGAIVDFVMKIFNSLFSLL